MPQELTTEIQEEIFLILQKTFLDFPLFNSLVSVKLRQAIAEANSLEINVKTTRKVVERYFSTDVFKTPEQKNALAQIQIIFKTCYTLILSYHNSSQSLKWPTVDVLLQNYPQFEGQDQEELNYLLNFRNYMKIALLIVPARLNKQCLLKICARLEGSQNEYVTGGGQKSCVTRRVEIYEKEGGVISEKRPDRPEKPLVQVASSSDLSTSNTTAGTKRKNGSVGPAYCSVSTIRQSKISRLPSSDIRSLLHHSDPTNGIPAMYQTQMVDSLQGLLDLRNQPSSSSSAANNNSNNHQDSSSNYFDSVPIMPNMYRGETDMLIATCGLLSSASDLWGEELNQVHKGASDGIITESTDLTAAAAAGVSHATVNQAALAVTDDDRIRTFQRETSTAMNNINDVWNSMEHAGSGDSAASSSNDVLPTGSIMRGFSDGGILFSGSLTEDLNRLYGGENGGSITADLKAMYG